MFKNTLNKIKTILVLKHIQSIFDELGSCYCDESLENRRESHVYKGIHFTSGICSNANDMKPGKFFKDITREYVSQNISTVRNSICVSFPVDGADGYYKELNKYNNPLRKEYLDFMINESIKKLNFIERLILKFKLSSLKGNPSC